MATTRSTATTTTTRSTGGDGDDTLVGGAEDDRLVGGAGTDSFSGDFSGLENQIIIGNDRIEARDGIAEGISCAPGSDVAVIDVIDVPATDPQNGCETVERAAGTAPPPGAGSAVGLRVRSTVLRYRDGRNRLSLSCAATATCRGVLSVRTRGSRPRTLVSGRYALSGGRTRTLAFRVGSAGKRAIGRKRSQRSESGSSAPGSRRPSSAR